MAEVVVIEQRQLRFRGSVEAWHARKPRDDAPRRPPPVELGSWFSPPDPSVPLVRLVDGLDPESRALALQLIESLCTQRKSTVLMVTHRQDERVFWQERVGGALFMLPARS